MKLKIGKPWIERIFVLVGLVAGAVAGAVGTYFWTVMAEERKLYLAERKAGYAELFDGTVELRRYQHTIALANDEKAKGNESKAIELESEANKQRDKYRSHYDKALFQIGVYGDADVVRALAKYWRAHFPKEPCANTLRDLDDAAIYQAMRRAGGAYGRVENKDLILVLFGCILQE